MLSVEATDRRLSCAKRSNERRRLKCNEMRGSQLPQFRIWQKSVPTRHVNKDATERLAERQFCITTLCRDDNMGGPVTGPAVPGLMGKIFN